MAVVGVDIGATKTQLAAACGDAAPMELALPTRAWRRRDDGDPGALIALIKQLLPTQDPTVLVIGAHGCDSAAACLELQRRLGLLTEAAVLVVNDAELLVPAAGFDHGIGVVAGTGSIAVARLPDRTMLVAGGWGWLLGDEGGAVGLVREAVRAVRGALDAGETTDPLIPLMQRTLGTDDPIQFGRKLLEAGTADAIGAHVSAVFTAAEAGSGLACAVVRDGGRALATLVRRLVGRGAVGAHVVAGGGVITRQSALMASFREAVAASLPDWRVTLLTAAPVHGALALARQIEAGRTPFGHAPDLPRGRAASPPAVRRAQ
jgi:glucosamine kinase